jgi:hypothetical protein
MSSNKVRVRFHLGAGEHYQHWQIRHPDGRVEYHHPDQVSLVMMGCRLRNQRHAAARIHAGSNKSVCAWVEAEDCYPVTPITRFWSGLDGRQIAYDPQVAPHWRDEAGQDIDGREFAAIVTSGRRLAAGADTIRE